MDALLIRAQAGLVPGDDPTRDWFNHIKLGATILAEARQMRNGAYFRKWWALVNLAYDYWSESVSTIEYKGEPVLPQLERFRKDLTITAGFYRPVVNLKGELRIEPESLRWASMTEERFAQLYDATIQVLLRRVFNGRVCPQWSEEQLRALAEQILEFGS